MAVENPPLNRIYVLGYSANDRDYPIVSMNLDPRVAGYKVPEDLSTCPNKRYPTHVFTGAQPISGDERVRHVWEILPSPWVPFTRYDDDLGPIQGRRRSVANTGQEASLASDKKISYEGREGSAIVSTEIEETWSIKTDEDGNSLFPIKDRDFYDPSKGPVQERRQLFVPTGEEEGSLENVNGVITQTSYEAYNEFLSVKIVQTYKVDGPALVGKATDNDGQLVTVTTQRKGALNYVPPKPTATRTVEVSREDAKSLIERVVDTPEIFKANTFSVERPDPIPQKFRVAVPIKSSQEIVAGTASTPILKEGEISKSEEQRNKFIKRISTSSRDQATLPKTLTGKTTNSERQEVTITETLQEGTTLEKPSATKTVEAEAIGDGNYVITQTQVDEVFGAEIYRKTRDDLTPQKFRGVQEESTVEQNVEGTATSKISLGVGEFSKSEQQVNKFVKRVSTTSRTTDKNQTLSESVLTPEGLRATRTLTLSNGPQSFYPSATLVEADVEELGDGRTVKTEITIPDIFDAESISIERPDSTPAKFRALVPSKTKQINIVGSINQSIALSQGEISKSETQQTKFVKRTTSTTRDQTVLPKTLTQKATSEDRQAATITETLQSEDTDELPTATTTIESEAVGDGNYVVRKTKVPEVFSAESYQKTKADLTPQKFRAAQEDLVFEATIEGQAKEPSLSEDEFAKTEQQVNKFVKRISTTARNAAQLPKSLTQKLTTNEGLLATVTETLQNEDTSEVPTSKKTVESEALGDGTYVVRVTESPKVFSAKTFRTEKADLTPQKFRAKQSDLTTEENVEGTAEQPTLDENQFLKSEQQINEFVKRVVTNTRDTESNETLSEFIITPEGQLATREITLSKSQQTLFPSANIIDGNIEELGDGRTIKTQTNVEQVFDGRQESLEKPEVIPPEFRASLQNRTISEVKEGTSINLPLLSQEELSKTIQRLTEHKIRETTVTRPTSSYPSLTSQLVDNDLITVNRTRTVAKSNQTITPSATVSGTVEALGDGYTLKTEDIKSKVFAAKAFSKEKPDNIPVEFRVEKPASTKEYNEKGDATEISNLSDTEISKSEQQVNEFVKRVRTTTRDDVGNVTLSEEQVDQDGVKVTVERQLSKGAQSINPSETVRGQVQNLGGGYTVKTTLTRNEVLELPSFSVEKPDVVPAAFRSQVQTTTEEKTIKGDAEAPTLSDADLSKAERQIDKFLKRTTTVSRPETISGTLTGEQIENDGIKSTVIRTLSDGSQTITPSAKVSGNVEDIGDGLTIKTEIVKAEIFEGLAYSSERPDPAPQKFRIEEPTITTEFNEEGQAAEGDVELIGNVIAKSSQQINKFIKRTRETSRDTTGGSSLSGQVFTRELGGGKATVVETYGNADIEPSFGTISAEKESLGGGKFLTRKITLKTPPTLSGQEYDDIFDIDIPYTEQVVRAEEEPTEGSIITPRDVYHSQKRSIAIAETKEKYLDIFIALNDIVNISLPDTLLNVNYKFNKIESGSDATSTGDTAAAQTTAYASYDFDIGFDIQNGYSGPAPAKRYIFFTDARDKVYEGNLIGKIASRIGSSGYESGLRKWPTYKTQSNTFTITIESEKVSASASVSLPDNKSKSFSSEKQTKSNVINVPSTIHGDIKININEEHTVEKTATATGPRSGTSEAKAIANARIKSEGNIKRTPITQIQEGLFLHSVNAQPYKFGLIKIEATVVEVTSAMK